MCHKLLQVYACGHAKTICTTACPHAIKAGQQSVEPSGNADLSRSSSVVSSVAPSVSWSNLHNPESQRCSQPQHSPGLPSPLRMDTRIEDQTDSPPAFYFLPPGQNVKLSVGQQPNPATPPKVSPSASALPGQTLQSVAESSSHASLEADAGEPILEPNYCPYYFPRYLAQSRKPCLLCYMQPEWEEQRKAWVAAYRTDHPLAKPEDAQRLSGIEGMRESLG